VLLCSILKSIFFFRRPKRSGYNMYNLYIRCYREVVCIYIIYIQQESSSKVPPLSFYTFVVLLMFYTLLMCAYIYIYIYIYIHTAAALKFVFIFFFKRRVLRHIARKRIFRKRYISIRDAPSR